MSDMTLQSTYVSFPPIAIAGQLEGGQNDIITLQNATASTSMPFGTPVKFKSGPTTDKDADVLSGSTDSVAGLIAYSTAFARQWTDSSGTKHGDLDGTGLVPGVMMNILRKGRIAVLCTSTTAVGNALHCAYNATGAVYTAVGQVGGSAETGHTLKTTGTSFLTSAAVGGFAWVDCNFVGSTSTGD